MTDIRCPSFNDLVRDFALLEAVGRAVEGVDALATLIAHGDRVHGLQHIEVVRNRRLLQSQSLGEFPHSLTFLCFPQETHELVPTLYTHYLEAVGAEFLLAHHRLFDPRWTGVRSCFGMSVFLCFFLFFHRRKNYIVSCLYIMYRQLSINHNNVAFAEQRLFTTPCQTPQNTQH